MGTVGAVGSVGSAGLVGRKVGAAGKSPVRAGTSPVISSTDIPPGKGFSGSGVGSGAFGFAGGAGAGAAVAGAGALASGASVGPIGGKGAITIDAPAKSVGGSVGAGAVLGSCKSFTSKHQKTCGKVVIQKLTAIQWCPFPYKRICHDPPVSEIPDSVGGKKPCAGGEGALCSRDLPRD